MGPPTVIVTKARRVKAKSKPSLLVFAWRCVEVPCFHCFQVIRLAYRLSSWLLFAPAVWIWMFVRLLCFTLLLVPGWIGFLRYYLFDEGITRNVAFGKGGRMRNLLDVYTPRPSSSAEKSHVGLPVVVFVSGGAWIIGYKAWSCLVARALTACGVIVVVPDYRNFPQGDLYDMCEDVRAAFQWTVQHIGEYGGSPDKIVLAGQSAGAHICLSALLDAYENAELTVAEAVPEEHHEKISAAAVDPQCAPVFYPLTMDALRQLHSVVGRYPTVAVLSEGVVGGGTGTGTPSHTWREVPTPTSRSTRSRSSTRYSTSPPAVQQVSRRLQFAEPVISQKNPTPSPRVVTAVATAFKARTLPLPRQKASQTPLDLSKVKLFIGVSGPYDLLSMRSHLIHRGLDASILSWICGGNLERCSPTRRILRRIDSSGEVSPSLTSPSGYCLRTLPFKAFTRTALFHGMEDVSVPVSICEELASALLTGGCNVYVKKYSGLSHTHPILEGPLGGENFLMLDMLELILDATGTPQDEIEDILQQRAADVAGGAIVHPFLLSISKMVNPF